MLAPDTLDPALFAPCGMNCLLCYRHLGRKPCGGCVLGAENKPASCRACKIRDCAVGRGIRHCFQCGDFPCKQMKALDKSYRTRYGVSLTDQGRAAAREGVEAALQQQTARYTCPGCGGLISLHDGGCSECGKQHPLGRRRTEP